MNRILITIALLLAVAAPVAAEKPETAEELAARVQKLYETVPSYSAEFVQTSHLRTTGQAMEARGTVAFKKPGKMRWVYETPMKQEIISDGETLWLYQPEDNQVMVSEAERFLKSRASITFLAGQGSLTEEFEVSLGEAPEGAAEGPVLELSPREEDPTVARVLLVVDDKASTVVESWVYDFMGNATSVRFIDPETGVTLDDEQFTFEAPRGTDVIQGNF